MHIIIFIYYEYCLIKICASILKALTKNKIHALICAMADKFNWDTYNCFIVSCRRGNLTKVQSTSLDTRLLFFIHTHGVPSPLVEAAYYGHLEIVKYLLETFGDYFDVNCGAKLTTKGQNVFYNVSPFLAACSNDKIELLNYLVNKGASIHHAASKWGSPLCVAVEHGNVSVIQYLVDCNIDVNITNGKGFSPLILACKSRKRDNSDIIKLLLSKGADAYQRTVEGYTAMHYAACSNNIGHIETLIFHGMSLMFAPADPMNPNYVPCPLYLSVRDGSINTMRYLMDHPYCPDVCKWEACLINWQSNPMDWEILENGLKYLEASSIKPVYLQSEVAAVYGSCKEISTKYEIDLLQTSFNNMESYYQTLLINERMFGVHNKIGLLTMNVGFFFNTGHNIQGNMILEHAMRLCLKKVELYLDHPFYNDTDEVVRLFNWAGDEVRNVSKFIRKGALIDMYSYCQLLKMLLVKVQSYLTLNCLRSLEEILYLIMNFCVVVCEKEDIRSQKLLKEFITDCLYQLDGSTMIHIFLKMCNDLYFQSTTELRYSKTLILENLLNWGHQAINHPDEQNKGNRPLHVCSDFEPSAFKTTAIEMLSSNGAHFDAVNGFGLDFLSILTGDNQLYNMLCSLYLPLPLTCLAAQSIIIHCLPYTIINLPQHIINFIALHDCKMAIKKPYIDIDLITIGQ